MFTFRLPKANLLIPIVSCLLTSAYSFASGLAQPISAKRCEALFQLERPGGRWTTPKSNPEILYHEASSTPDDRTAIMPSLREEWLFANRRAPVRLRRALKWLSYNIEVIKKEQVLANVETSFQQFLQKNQNRPLVFLVNEQRQRSENKSGAWLTGFMKDRYPQLSSAPVIVVGSAQTGKLAEYLASNSDTQVVVIDDFAYSGSQLHEAVKYANESLQMPSERVHVIVGFSSTYAANILAPITKEQLYYSGKIRTIAELVSESNPRYRSKLEEDIRLLSEEYMHISGLPDFCITIADYKAPDAWSFPTFLMKGYLFDVNGAGHVFRQTLSPGGAQPKTMPFIHQGIPSYKKVPYLDPETKI